MPIVPKNVTYLEKVVKGENVSKFWALTFEPTTSKVPAIRVWYGRIGTVGNTKVLDGFSSDEVCLLEATRRTQEKLREGYKRVEVCSWWPEVLKNANRAPSITGWNEDGWPLVDGRARRPDEAKKGPLGPVMRPILKAPPPTWLDRGVDRARGADRTVVTVVQIATERVIDFEE